MDPRTIRERLKEINAKPLDQQLQALQLLKKEVNVICEIIACPMQTKEELFNCFMFAADLHDDSNAQLLTDKRQLPLEHPLTLVQQDCMREISREEIICGDLVYYLKRKRFTEIPNDSHHAGKVFSRDKELIIISKWGRFNHHCIWLHALEAVPSSYEDYDHDITVRFFRPDPSKMKALAKDVFEREVSYLKKMEDQKKLFQ